MFIIRGQEMRTMLKSLLLLALLGTLGAFAASDIAAEVEYFYAKDGTIIGRAVNGVRSDYEYDAKGQLLAVKDAKTGEIRESYTYDPAGNILSKSVYGATTVYTYDASNQLVSANTHGTKTTYAYDAVGRLICAGSKSYRYGFRDKVLEVRDGAGTRARFSYYMDGQLKQAKYADRTENFMWDGLALVKRDSVNFINEPHVTGGNPVLAGNSVMFNDMLGSTLAVDGKHVDMTVFGDSDDPAAMFTGKPHVDELGYVFLFRNYRAELGKWQTADPLGYPDGWNNFAYCNNGVVDCIDILGNNIFQVHDKEGAGGAGHSAWVAEKTNGKYHIVDFNPKGDLGTRTAEFDSLQKAIEYLNRDNHRYESYLEYNTTPAHGDAFVNELLNNINNGYNMPGNNCYTAGANAYNNTNPDPYAIPLHIGNDPNYSYARNKQNVAQKHVIE